MSRAIRFLLPVLACLSVGRSAPASASFIDWANSAGGTATLNTNWSPAFTPGPFDEALFRVPATFTTTWASPVDTIGSLVVNSGNPNFSIADHLGVSGDVQVYGTSSLTVSSGRLTTGTLAGAATTLGQLVVTGGTSLVDAGSVTWGATAGASSLMTLQNGGQLWSRGGISLAGSSGTSFVGDIHHRGKAGSIGHIRVVLPVMASAPFAGVTVGGFGSASLSVYDEGTVSSGGDLLVGGYPGGFGLLHTYVSGLAGGVIVTGQTYVGANSQGPVTGGNGTLLVEGWGDFVGRVWLGDLDEASGGPVRGVFQVDNGGNAVLAGGLTMNTALSGRLDVTGGSLQLIGGSATIRQASPFEVGSAGSHTPVLWLENGATTDIWPPSAGDATLGIGRAGTGTVRVAGAGTALVIHGDLAVADSSNGFGTMICDSGATVTVQGKTRVANGGVGFLDLRAATTVATFQDTVRLGLGANHTGAIEADSGATAHLQKTAFVGAASGGELLAYSGGHLDVAGATVGPSFGLLECGGGGSTLTVSDHLDLTGAGFVVVDSGGVFAYTNPARAVNVGARTAAGVTPQFIVNHGALAQLAAELDVAGQLLFEPSNTTGLTQTTAVMTAARGARVAAPARTLSAPGRGGRLECPLTRILGNGQAIAVGTIAGRFHLDSSTGTLAVSQNDTNFTGSLIAGDSTRSDGFVSIGSTTLGLDTLQVLDSDGGDLGKVSIAGGLLELPHAGHLKSGFLLSGYGRIDGSLDARDSSWVSFRGAITGDLALAGTLDVGPTAAGLVLGSLHPSATGRVTLKTGHLAQDVVIVTGTAALAGTLDLRAPAGDFPAVGDTFTVLLGAVSGTFANVTFDGKPAASVVHVLYRAGDVRVAVVGAVTAVDSPPAPAPPARLRFAAAGDPREPAVALELPSAASVRVAFFDVTGRRVAALADAELAAGRHRFELATRLTTSGVFFARASVVDRDGPHLFTARLVVLH